MQIPAAPTDLPELEDYNPQVRRLVAQMQGKMKQIWSGQRGIHRAQNIRNFNVEIANIIEHVAFEWKLKFEESKKTVEMLRGSVDKILNDKWTIKDKLEIIHDLLDEAKRQRDEARKERDDARDQLTVKINEMSM